MNNITEKNNKKLVWNDNLQQDLKTKNLLITEKTLLHNINYSKTFIIPCDASKNAIGCILCQEIKDDTTFETHNNLNLGDLKAVCCFSRLLTPAQINYNKTEKELLAVISSLQHLEIHVNSNSLTTTIATDFRNLLFFENYTLQQHQHIRWIEEMENNEIKYIHDESLHRRMKETISRSRKAGIKATNKTITLIVKKCRICQKYKNSKYQKTTTMGTIETPS
jgi:RNase H-like domain found in reverse transcriptase